MGFLKAIGESMAAQMVIYTFTAFIFFTTVVSLLGGVSDTVYASRAAATTMSAFVFLYPRAPIGTASGGMPDVYAFLTLLGMVDLCTYHGFLRQDSDRTENAE